MNLNEHENNTALGFPIPIDNTCRMQQHLVSKDGGWRTDFVDSNECHGRSKHSPSGHYG